MRVKCILVLFIVFIGGCAIREKQDILSESKVLPSPKKSYFIEAPITKLSSIQCPCVNVEIDSKQFSMELDLGFRGNLTIKKDHLDFLENKTFLFEKLVYGVRGNQYPVEVYRVPNVKIGQMTFMNPSLEKENQQFIKDSVFVADGGKPSPREEGRLGWELFQKVNLLIDVKNACVAFCDSLNTLATHGYPIETFIKTPLILDKGLVQILADTPEGSMEYILDTGATWNILNRSIESTQSLDKAVWEPENTIEFAYFRINNEDFGPLSFHRLPIGLPFHVDGILGVEFFEENLVFLNFSEGMAYFSKKPFDGLPNVILPQSKVLY
jgi:hypothetical protein